MLFATNRVREDWALGVEFESLRSDSLTFGASRVHVPEDHRIGNIELPNQGYKFFDLTFGREGPISRNTL